jgi:hypothetical protein
MIAAGVIMAAVAVVAIHTISPIEALGTDGDSDVVSSGHRDSSAPAIPEKSAVLGYEREEGPGVSIGRNVRRAESIRYVCGR